MDKRKIKVMRKNIFCLWLLLFILAFSACTYNPSQASDEAISLGDSLQNGSVSLPDDIDDYTSWCENIPPYNGNESISINQGIPYFTSNDLTTEAFENYSELDDLERCGTAFANVCQEIMPTEERGNISHIKPSGWHTVEYDVIADKYLYNRCHLIGYQLAGENANELNLITGTRYLNVEGMLPWENQVAEYVKETENHVLYRVTPYFEKENLVASGVLMEAYSVEDSGDGICFNVYCYNVQPGIIIDYATGENSLDESWSETYDEESNGYDYVLNTSTKKFHSPNCSSVQNMSDKNRDYFTGERESLIEDGYSPCSRCNP